MANKPEPDKNPERGWGQVLNQFFNDDVIIKNHAVKNRLFTLFRLFFELTSFLRAFTLILIVIFLSHGVTR